MLENPSTDADAVGVEITVNLIGAGGEVVKTATHSVVGVPAGAQFAVGGEADISGERVRRMEVSVTASEGAPAGRLTLPEATRSTVFREDFGTTVRVQVRNTMDAPLSSIADVFAVLRDSSGKIIGGLSGFPQADIQPGARAAVELSSISQLPEASSAHASTDGESAP